MASPSSIRSTLIPPKTDKSENYRKLLLAMVKDIRVIIVKLADRLAQHAHARCAASGTPRADRRTAETLDIYAPIAHRLGMGKVRGELEDLAFVHIEPEAAAEISRTIEDQRTDNEKYLEKMRSTVEAELRREGIPARVQSRVKRAFSVYQKLKRQRITLDQVGTTCDGSAHRHHRFREKTVTARWASSTMSGALCLAA